MEFVFDALADGRPIKCLTVVDDCTKECVAIALRRRLNRQGVTDALEVVCRFRAYPTLIRTDQGPEFTGRALDQWASINGVRLMRTQPGKPTQNAYMSTPTEKCPLLGVDRRSKIDPLGPSGYSLVTADAFAAVPALRLSLSR